MAKSRVPLYGKPQGFVTVDTDATAGATVGRDLRWPSGAVVTEAELRAAATPPGQGDYPVTYWRLIQEIPPNVVALEQTHTAGLYVVTGTGTSATRAIQARPGQLVVADGDGVDGDPTLGLAAVEDSGSGALLALERDGFGRVTGTRTPTTDDLPEGEDNLYFTDERAASAGGLLYRVAADDLGGHRIVRSADAVLIEYADHGDAEAAEATLGMTTGASEAGARAIVRTRGPLTFDGWAWTPDDPVFLGADGMPTQIPPTPDAGAAFAQVIGHAESPTTLYLDIHPSIYF